MTIYHKEIIDPDDLAEVMAAQRLLKQLIEDRPVVEREDPRDGSWEALYEMPDGTFYDTNDANPADFLEGWMRKVMFRGTGVE